MSNGELTAKPGESTDDFKARINAKIAEKKAALPPLTPAPRVVKEEAKPEVKAESPAPTSAQKESPAQPPAVTPQAAQPEQKTTLPQGEQVDLHDWARKKGIKDEESALRALRSLETEFHKRNQDKAKPQGPQVPQAEIPQPVYQPQPQMPQWTPVPQMPPQMPYPQTPPPLNREQAIAELARQYNMDPQDFERVYGVASDIAGVEIRKVVSQLQNQMNAELSTIRRENQRNTEIRRLMNDPDFSNPEVQFEMHRILEENPAAFNVEPAPYTWAFNEAMRNVARKSLRGTLKREENGSIPSRPPQTAGGGEGSGASKSASDATLTAEKFAHMALEDKQKLLTSIGARPAL